MHFNITAFNLFSSLRNRNYRFLWFATLFNQSGQWIQMTTLGWLVWKLSESAMLVGVTTGLRVIPFLFMGPITGVIADRIDRRRILMLVQITMAVMAILFTFVVATGGVRVWHAMLFSFVMGCGFTMCGPVMQALVANTVPREGMGNAIALTAMAFNVSRVVGPGNWWNSHRFYRCRRELYVAGAVIYWCCCNDLSHENAISRCGDC